MSLCPLPVTEFLVSLPYLNFLSFPCYILVITKYLHSVFHYLLFVSVFFVPVEMIGFHNFCSTIRPSRTRGFGFLTSLVHTFSTASDSTINNAIHRVNAHMLSHKIDLHDFREKLHNCKAKYTFNDSFILVKECPDFSHDSGPVLLTNSGIAVLWGNSSASLPTYRSLVQESDESNITFDSFSESLEVVETTGKTRVHDGTISLTTSDNREYDQIAISFAMINAVKLNYLELDITNALELKNNALNELVNVVKSHKLDRLARTLFDLETRAHNCRYRLNLQQDLLEYPDVLWDYDKQCDLFNRVQITFDIPKRLDNLNHRISWTIQTLNSYSDYVRHKHSSRLEKIIIAVISVELALALIQALRSNMNQGAH